MIMVVVNARDKPGASGPFAWQSIFILRHLRELGESARSVSIPSIVATYSALTELACNHGEASFRAPISEIASKSGLGYRTVAPVLRLIADAGIIHVKNNYLGDGKLKTSNTYTILKHDPSICKFCLSYSEGRKPRSLPKPLEDKEEELEEERTAPSFLNEHSDEWVIRAKNEFPERTDVDSIAKKFFAHYEKKPGARCYERLLEWIRDERNPKIRSRQKAADDGPPRWRQYFPQELPVIDYPTRTIYENGDWNKVPREVQSMVIEWLKQTG
jgi:hypothetical protein